MNAFVYETHGFIKVDLFEDEIKASTFFHIFLTNQVLVKFAQPYLIPYHILNK